MKLYYLLPFLFFAVSCNSTEDGPANGTLEFYRIDQFRTNGEGCKIDENTIEMSDVMLLSLDDIKSYSTSSYTFTLREGIAALEDDLSIHQTPFAVVVDGDLIYSGYFWVSYSSLSCSWVTADPISYAVSRQLTIQLGYPGLMEGDHIPDHRNDMRILNVLKAHGKLKN